MDSRLASEMKLSGLEVGQVDVTKLWNFMDFWDSEDSYGKRMVGISFKITIYMYIHT